VTGRLSSDIAFWAMGRLLIRRAAGARVGKPTYWRWGRRGCGRAVPSGSRGSCRPGCTSRRRPARGVSQRQTV